MVVQVAELVGILITVVLVQLVKATTAVILKMAVSVVEVVVAEPERLVPT
jgi:hypothetical protein